MMSRQGRMWNLEGSVVIGPNVLKWACILISFRFFLFYKIKIEDFFVEQVPKIYDQMLEHLQPYSIFYFKMEKMEWEME